MVYKPQEQENAQDKKGVLGGLLKMCNDLAYLRLCGRLSRRSVNKSLVTLSFQP